MEIRVRPRPIYGLTLVALMAAACAPAGEEPTTPARDPVPVPEFTLPAENTHARWSRTIPPVLTVPSGAVVEVFTQEATGGQLSMESDLDDLAAMDCDRIHALTGPGFGFLADVFTEPYLKLFELGPKATHAVFNDRIRVPLAPFAGVMGVAPDTDSLLVTIPPRANGGNMDNRHMTAGTTVFFPIFVEGALFSIGDTHAAQGNGEVSGTAIEAPMRIVYELNVLKGGRELSEPEYETSDYYAVTGFGTTIDEAARKATLFMIDYLVAEHGMDRADAYVLASLAGDLKISETVDMPHYLVSMHMPKEVLGVAR